ncbi:uncharacterized protein BDZ99DRAFT_464522 [Mytilinidion resinicola]|uniref:DUF567-domain-containing protein n=1 Tax=Mytilinidion resinicola TaxID=574789 RepID=A0A6A6YG88_9PEZI|nr:uncharacterized protein BDZ99DRAFT_464522 [Mytilinidion resinicola]KAF2807588.1 hypothetical protein BDZ99DRAFT_464522 [Mytilinidion resinicola]
MALPPLREKIGFFPQHIAGGTETLVLKEHVMSLSGDSFSIKTADGRPVFQVKGDVLSLSGRKHLMDEKGEPIFDIRKEHLTFHTTYYCEDPSGKKIFEVGSKFSPLGSKAVATFTSFDGKAKELEMKGDWLEVSANIVDLSTGEVVAKIDRTLLSGKDIFFGQQTYALTIAKGADMALMVAMVIALDEKKEKK